MIIAVPADGVFHHEDLVAGTHAIFGALDVTRGDIVAFASDFDPQPMHLDEEAAKASVVGGLCASGFHTCAMMMRLLCDNFLGRSASLGSPGVDEVKWLRPVRPGDRLSLRINVLETRDLKSRANVGLSKMLFEVLDQAGTPVMSAETNQLMRRRQPGPLATAAAQRPKAKIPARATLWDEPVSATSIARGAYFEDIIIGEVCELGAHTFGRDDIIAFARQFDPQPFHLDEEAGKRSLFGGLAASGWHTAALFIRQNVRAGQSRKAAFQVGDTRPAAWGPSPGFRDMQWLRPVLAGDRIEYRCKTIEARELKSRPDRGLMISLGEGRNQHGEIVYRFTGQILIERRRGGVART